MILVKSRAPPVPLARIAQQEWRPERGGVQLAGIITISPGPRRVLSMAADRHFSRALARRAGWRRILHVAGGEGR